MSLPTTTELLLAWDALRPRSQQQEIGMSALGACRRQTGYRISGVEPDPGFADTGIQNVMGTAIHQAAAEGAQLVLDGAQAESIEICFGGLKGHPDLWHDGVVRDIKTLSYSMQLEDRRANGPKQRERFQAHTYGAGCHLGGFPTHTIQLDYIARDSGDEYIFEEPFDVAVVEEAMAWLAQVRDTDPRLLSRDYRPDSAICQNCEFFRRCWDAEPGRDPRSVLFRDDPDAAAWAAKLRDARARRKQAEADEKDAAGALDVLRTVNRPGEKQYVAVPGLEQEIRFSVANGKRSPDMAQIAIDYKNAGARPPMKRGDPIISVALVKPKPREE